MIPSLPSSFMSSSSSSLSSGSSQQRSKEDDHHRRSSRKSVSVLFKETVQIRKHIHFMDITPEERIATWFHRLEYHAISDNNFIIIREIGKLNKKKKKMDNNNKMKKMMKKMAASKKKDKGSLILHENLQQQKQQLFQKQQQRHRTDHGNNENFFEREEEICCQQNGYSTRGLERKTSSARIITENLRFEALLIVSSKNKGEYSLTIAQKYNEMCLQCTEDARQRGLRDEKIARRIHQQSSQDDDHFIDQEYCCDDRRPSYTSTASTASTAAITIKSTEFEEFDNDDNDCNNCLNDDNGNNTKQSHRNMNHTKRGFLRRLPFPSSNTAAKKGSINKVFTIPTTII